MQYAARLLATTALTAPFLAFPAVAQNLPTGASVAAGSVSIAQPSATQMTITQSSPSAVVNYNAFSIGAGHAVNIAQPSVNAALLNRVTGETPSTIAGSLTANGQVYLVNPNGIAITPSGTVNVGGGFVASTLGISDSDFMSGKRTFAGSGASGAVSNAGSIRVGRGGYAALIGGTVDNSGSIEVPLGKVGLGSGERATLDFSGDGFLQVAAPTKSGGDGALIKHSGRIKADGGSVVISAATAREAARNAINLSGHVQARSISGHNGSITIGGGNGGRVRITGKLNVASRKHKGGHVTVTGRDIALHGATINASGKTGGGSVKIGGDWQGKGSLQHADTTSVDAMTTIKADAIASGNGGKVVVWSDQLTTFAGTISAKGGTIGGNGGDAEVSGKATLAYTGFTDLSAPSGNFGTLLLDPYNVTISNGADSNHTSFTATGNDSVINVTTLQTALGGANVVVSTGAGGAQAGDITVAAPVTWSSATTLTLDAYHSVAINAPITIAGAGGLALVTNHGGTLSFAGGVQYTGSGGSLTINSQPYTLLYSMADLQGINTDAGLSGRYALAKSLDASAIPANGAGEWIPLGTDGDGGRIGFGFAGTFTGLGNTISNLTVNTGSRNYAGLFGYSMGSISDIGMVGGSVTGGSQVGGLVGYQMGGAGSVTQAYATGAVGGGSKIGGLVGETDNSNITRSYATGAVNGDSFVGGLVGYHHAGGQGGLITESYATGAVAGSGSEVGGLVGSADHFNITKSYATGAVKGGGGNVGGLLGTQGGGNVTSAYATGAVTGSGRNVGGLVGYQYSGGILQSYATGAVIGGKYTGGLVGYQFSGFANIVQSYATGVVTGSGDYVGGLAGYQVGNIEQAYATGAVTGSGSSVGGLVGYQAGGTIVASYFDSYATGQADGNGVGNIVNVSGVAGVTSDPTQVSAPNYAYKQSAYSGLTFTATPGGTGWYMVDGQTRPFGAWEYSENIVNSHQLQLVNMDLGASYRLARSLDLAGEFGRAGVANPTPEQSAGMWNRGFVPLGTNGAGGEIGFGFNGEFTGLGNTISNLTVDIGTNQYAGLFGYLQGNLSDIGLLSGSVKGGAAVGGLVGFQGGGRISRAYATGVVNGSNTVGGLVGFQDSGGNITQAYATGAVNGAQYVGGLVGVQAGGIIGQAYATGNVSGSSIVGGLVGYQISGGSIGAGYATGRVNGGYYVGGLLGGQAGGHLGGSYFDSYSTGQSNALGTWSSGTVIAVGAVTSDPAQAGAANYAYKQSAYGYLTFTNTPGGNGWYMINGETRPFGTWEYSQTIANSHQLQLVNMDLNASYQLARNIDLAGQFGRAGVSNPTPAQSAGMWNRGFVPLGTDGAGNVLNGGNGGGFTGNFTGLGSTISNLTVDIGSNNYAGLFGYSGGAIRDIGVVGGSMSGGFYVGGLVGWQAGGGIVQAYATGVVRGTGSSVGGLVGNQSAGEIVQSYATGAVTSTLSSYFNESNVAGGLVGSLLGGNIVRSYASGTVAGNRNVVGGLVGKQEGGSVTDSYAVGEVNGGSSVGGLVGSQSAGTITQSYATGAVTGTGTDVGGLVGIQRSDGSITQSYATGAVNGGTDVGGLVGIQNFGGSITQSYATGAVSGGSRVGGLVGIQYYDGSIVQSYATGAVNGGTNVGGLVGLQYHSSITEAYAAGAVNGGGGVVGGLVGDIGDQPGANVTTGYFDRDGTGQTLGVGRGPQTGVTALSSASGSAFVKSNYVGFDWTVWSPPSPAGGGSPAHYPQLFGVSGVVGVAYAAPAPIVYGDSTSPFGAPTAIYGVGYFNNWTAAPGTGTVASTDAGSQPVVSSTTVTAAFTPGGSSRLVYLTTLDITPALLTVAANAASKVYGDADPALTFAASGFQFADNAASVLSGGLTRAAGENVGSYAIGQGSLASNANYTIAFSGANIGITPALLTVAANAASKVYGDADPALIYAASGFKFADNAASVLSGGLTRTAGENVGGYAIGQGGLAANANYTIAFTGANLGVTRALLTVAANAASKVYGDADPALTFAASGFKFSDNAASVLSGGLTRAAGENVGSYAIGQGGLVANPNYTVAFTGANLDVTRALLTVAANAASKVYGDADPALTFTANGFKFTDDAASVLSGGLTRAAGENVGSYAIGQGGLAANANYSIVFTGANLGIAPALLTVAANAASKVYGDADPALTYAASGFQFTDNAASVLSGALTRAAGENVGGYAIGQGGLVANPNYSIAFTGANLGITPALLTIAANAASKVYGDADPALTFAASGFKFSDNAASVLSGGLTRAAGENVGSYAIGQGGLVTTPNYSIAFTGANLGIAPALLTVAANAASKVYGDADPALTYAASGFQFADNAASVLSGGLARAAGESVGSYAIGQGGLASNANYTIAFTGANLGIAPALLTIAANAASKVYGDADPALTYVASGWKNGDTAGSVLSGALTRAAGEGVGSYAIGQGGLASNANYSIAYTGANLGITPALLTIAANNAAKVYGDADPALTYVASGWKNGDNPGSVLSGGLTRAAGENVGGYTIGLGGLVSNGNYSIAYTGANLGITPALLTIAANAASKTYGQTTTFAGTEFTASGLRNGETIGSVSLTSLGAAATADVTGSPYGIAASAATGGTFNAANYTISYVGGHLTVTPAALTVIADAQTRLQGEANPPFTYQVSGSLFNNDRVTGALATSATASSSPGAYPINQGSLRVSPNYELIYKPALLTVLPQEATTPFPVVNFVTSASRVVFDDVNRVNLPANARPVFGAPTVIASLGLGVFYADPRFDKVFVCFSSAAVPACFAVNP